MRSHCMRQRRCYNHALIGCNRSRDACGRRADGTSFRIDDLAVSSRSGLWHLAA